MNCCSTMKTLAVVALLVAAGGAAALAQPGSDKKQPEAPKAPAGHGHDHGKPAAGQPPAGMPDMAAMMAAYEKAAKPGKEHEHLAKAVGEWKGKVSSWMPGAPAGTPPSVSDCTTVIKSILGGRFTTSETKGSMDMGGPEKFAFEGFGVYGFNNLSGKFESTWADNMGTMMLNFVGEMDKEGKALTMVAKFKDPVTMQDTWMREVETWTGPDSMTLEMFGPGMDGKDMKMMQIDYTRVKAAGAK